MFRAFIFDSAIPCVGTLGERHLKRLPSPGEALGFPIWHLLGAASQEQAQATTKNIQPNPAAPRTLCAQDFFFF